METLTLNDGTVLLNSSAHENKGYLFIYIQNGFSLRQVFNLMIEPEKTRRITKMEAGRETVYEGYEKLISVRDEENGYITAILTK